MRLVIVTGVFGLAVLVTTVRAQDINALKTEMGVFEAQTNTILVKGVEELGHVYMGAATVNIACKETNDVTHGRKEYGAALELAGGPDLGQIAILDEDELAPLLNGLDYLTKINHDVTALDAFEAEYTTRYGLRFIGFCRQKPGSIRYFIQVNDGRKVELTDMQLKQLSDLIDKTQDVITKLKQPK